MKRLKRLFFRILWHLRHGFPKAKAETDPHETQFAYSAEWYHTAYHVGRVQVDRRSFEEINGQVKNGYRRRLESVLNRICVPSEPIEWLEAGCHLGLTAYWIASEYPNARMHMIDFSQTSVDWCRRTFPYQDRATIWQGSVTDIRLAGKDLAGFFDFATCLDVTEHLPPDLYNATIRELWRVIKPGGFLLLMQGNTPGAEHIHVLPEGELVSDFVKAGFDVAQYLPRRHYLLRRADASGNRGAKALMARLCAGALLPTADFIRGAKR